MVVTPILVVVLGGGGGGIMINSYCNGPGKGQSDVILGEVIDQSI